MTDTNNEYTYEELLAITESIQTRGLKDDLGVYMHAVNETTGDARIAAQPFDFNLISNVHYQLLLEGGPAPLMAVFADLGLAPIAATMLAIVLESLIAKAKAEEVTEVAEDAVLEQEVIG